MNDRDNAFVSRRGFLQASAASILATQAIFAGRTAMAAPSLMLNPASTTAVGIAKRTAASYIVTRLAQHGADILFGVPGATCDPLFAAAAGGNTTSVVVTSSDLEAGYAADGFARIRGLSALSVTYGVGTMSLLAVIGGAYAERSPIVVINGGPSRLDLRLQREHNALFSHSTGRDRTDLAMFEEVTAFAKRAKTAAEVPRLVDGAIRSALIQQRPVYLEIPKNLWNTPIPGPGPALDANITPSGRERRLAAQILTRMGEAKRPVVLLGIELQRYGLVEQAANLVRKLGVPYSTTMLAKAVLAESTPGFAGVYIGTNSVPAVRTLLEQSDAVLTLGCVFGRQFRNLVTKSTKALMIAANDEVRLASDATPASLRALLNELLKHPYTARAEHAAHTPLQGLDFAARRESLKQQPVSSPEPGLTYDGVLGKISGYVDETFAVITDTSLSMYPAADLNIPSQGAFVCNGVWQSIGFSVGAALGVALASGKRPLVICGDGGFQMTAQALSTMARAKLKSVVVVLDNGIYGIEQFLLKPQFFTNSSVPELPYVGLNRWNYPDLARAVGFKEARTVSTLDELDQALGDARGAAGPVLISAVIRRRDLPSQLLKG